MKNKNYFFLIIIIGFFITNLSYAEELSISDKVRLFWKKQNINSNNYNASSTIILPYNDSKNKFTEKTSEKNNKTISFEIVKPSLNFYKTSYDSEYVKGYYRKNGTYVKPHHKTRRNHTKRDNWSTKGNRNPYTGKKGYKSLTKKSFRKR